MKPIKALLAIALAATTALGMQAQRTIELENPTMKMFLPAADKASGRAVVILPGGGYSHLAVNHEGYDWAPFFNDRGTAIAVVSYRMPAGDRTLPISDAEKAVKILRDSAEVWHLDPTQIGIMGSSAGGHLASTVATHAPAESRPNFQILFYPVISMVPGITHQGSHDNLLGADAPEALVNEYSNEQQVDSLTPRAFLILSADDKVVIPRNSIDYFNALNEASIPVSMHIYPTGGHGWGSRPTFEFNREVLAELDAWLKTF